ncbi:MAG: 1-(5-phosphoribosyl)-5-[(5-phosphoribosylamino) methylideneamino] imidazole-4-carboxamide isomerase [Tepidiforma sp.]|uniref:1-(5-phosphoribosyl)-5-[(5- phosphoribosylamino)methylideneamino]imidazole-4- carboxamide isomerase n=1 Tax=Tepidiforma sp. TaxID=2682230 RepID=UPI0021DC7BEA|nr:1-(5-phosphoribosyl)-5-[(5-phosphoribosylamino)methylideneamino]imidazole-4-carboxamide isomerase [Tepidiforma sp.]GIW16522.1 MAG: 1-(5-phosphoribosyl)-5-[(5-phosphoribosylamino) methylideneamino] imidazole-4-carboxamide isomerase [Tepidiforma sp.]
MSFEVIPAIDLRGGRCVRLRQGDYGRETAYSDDPVAVARQWQAEGARRLHVVDLDGAREGRPVNTAVIEAICRAVAIPVEVSGGIRTLEAIAAALARGADRVQLGSIAVKDPALTRAAIQRFGPAIVVAIDARDGEVRTDGWLHGSNVRALDLARELDAAGVARIMFTDISRDGTLSEPNFQAYRDLLAAVRCPVIASGGISTLDHLRELAAIGCEGAIVGTSLYEHRFTLREALAAVATA